MFVRFRTWEEAQDRYAILCQTEVEAIMYRRVNSGRFIGLTTFGIVIVMAVFTWVMYGMAQQVFIMTDIMVELSNSFKSMNTVQVQMATDIHNMSTDISQMTQKVGTMSGSVEAMSGSIESMTTSINSMSRTMGGMTDAMHSMAVNVSRMAYDVSLASHAMANPMSYMWGNSFPF